MEFYANYIYASLIIALISLLLMYCYTCNRYWQRLGVLTLPPTLFFGSTLSLIRQEEGIFTILKNLYTLLRENNKSIGGYYFFTEPVLVLSEIGLIKRVMVNDSDYFVDRPGYCDEKRDPLSANLVFLKGKKWSALRRKLTPAFSPGKLKFIFEDMVMCSRDFINHMNTKVKNGEVINIGEEVSDLVMDMIGSFGFGINCNSAKDTTSEFKYYAHRFLNVPSKLECAVFLTATTAPNILKALGITAFNKEMTNFFLNFAKELIKHRKDNEGRKDFMHLLLKIKNTEIREDCLKDQMVDVSNEEGLTLNEIAAQCFVYILGSYGTTTKALTFCFLELSLHTEMQDKARDEILKVLEKNDGMLTYDSLGDMKYVDACISETLRKYPTGSTVSRVCAKPYKIPNTSVTLKKGMTVVIPILWVHRDPRYFPNPDKFDPDRFSEENKHNIPSGVYIPFGDGPRSCIGLRLGLLQMKFVLVNFLMRYKLSLHSSTQIPVEVDKRSIFLRASSSIFLRVENI